MHGLQGPRAFPCVLIGTHSNQSMARILLTSSVGRPRAVRTMTMVTIPAWGTLAAPMEAAVAVMLERDVK